MSPLDVDPPRCPKCNGMMTGTIKRVECIPPPPGFVAVDPDEWSAGCHTVLVWSDNGWTKPMAWDFSDVTP